MKRVPDSRRRATAEAVRLLQPGSSRRPVALFKDSRAGAGLASAALGLALCGGAGFAQTTHDAAVVKVHVQQDRDYMVLRVQLPYGVIPDIEWSGAGAPPYRLALTWQEPAPDGSVARFPALLPKAAGPVQASAFTRDGSTARLEFKVAEPITPWLRQSGEAWDLRLMPAPATAPATSIPLAPQSVTTARVPFADTAPVSAPVPRVPAPAEPSSYVPVREQLLVDLIVNGQRQPDVALAERTHDGKLLIAADKWVEARLVPLDQPAQLSDGTPAYALSAVPGARFRLDPNSMSLEVHVPPGFLEGSSITGQPEAVATPPRPAPGLMLNYDLHHTRAPSSPSSSGAALEIVAFGGFGNFVTSALVRQDAFGREATRLDSYWRYDLPGRMQTLVVGDTVGASGGWSRPVRYGGLRWGRDFGLRPGFVTAPQPSMSGEAALASTVEVMVNNARRITQPIQPGPFDIQNIPVVSGAGEINLLVRDLLGRETVIQQSYYASPELLAAGLSDFSFEAGWMRTGYGHDSDYADPFAASTLRRGITDGLSAEGRLELQRERQAAGIEVASLLGTWGLGRMALAGSRSNANGPDSFGHLVRLGIERRTPLGGGALHYEYASRDFAPFGEASGADVSQRARQRLMANLGGRIWGSVSGGVSYVRQVRWDGDRVESMGLSLSLPIARASLGLSALKRLDVPNAWSALLTVNLPLGGGVYSGSLMRRGEDGKLEASISAMRNPPAGPGIGWRAEASTLQAQRARASAQYINNQGELRADIAADANGRIGTRLNAVGTLGYLSGIPFASRPVGTGSFAVVQVEGMEGVPVMRSNQVVATTDARGLAFVPNLVAWHKNVLEIDPINLPLDAEIGNVRRVVVPYARSGALVRFEIHRTRQALLVLKQPNGEPVPVGTLVKLMPQGSEFMAGKRGEVWLTDIAGVRSQMEVSWERHRCTLPLVLPETPAGEPPTVGPLVCGT